MNNDQTTQLLALWSDEETRLSTKVAALKAKDATVTGNSQDDKDLVNYEAKLARLKLCRHEFKAAFGLA